MHRALVVLLVAASSACLARPADEPSGASEGALRFRNVPVDSTLRDVDAVGYAIDLTVTDAPRAEAFRATVTGSYVANEALSELALDFEGNVVDDVRVDGRPAAHRREGARLFVTLPAGVGRGRAFTTKIAYHGEVGQADAMKAEPHTAFGGLMVKQRNAEGRRLFTTMSWPSKARRWLPLRDHPSDVAQVRFSVRFPSAYTVVANGKRTANVDNGDGTKTWRYEALTPMPVYDFHVSAYDGWQVTTRTSTSNVPITTYAYGRSASVVSAVYGDVPEALTFLESTFGPYRWGSLSYLEEPIFGGGMEHASVISMDEDLFGGPAWARYTALHELGHHWSGNLVHIRRWNDFWLSEGMTQFLTAKMVGHLDGPDAERTTLRGFLVDALDAESSSAHPVAPLGDEADIYGVFDATSYQKGALVLRMLEGIVGDEAMTAFLKGWFDRHGFGPATSTDDFRRELEAASGKDLGALFAGFVHDVYHPELRVRVVPAAAGVDVTVEQVQTRGPADGFAFPLGLDLMSTDGARHRVELDVQGRSTTVHVADAATSWVVDPDERALAVVTCGAPGDAPCKTDFRCTSQHDGVSACVPR